MQGLRRNLVPILVGVASVMVSLASVVVLVDHWPGRHDGYEARYMRGFDDRGGMMPGIPREQRGERGFDMRDRSTRPFQMMPGFRDPSMPGDRGAVPGQSTPLLGVTAQAQVGGVGVQSVQPDSPAAKAGVQPGDLIVRADGKDVPSVAALRDILSRIEAGRQYDLVVRRDGAEQTLRVESPRPTT